MKDDDYFSMEILGILKQVEVSSGTLQSLGDLGRSGEIWGDLGRSVHELRTAFCLKRV